MAVSPSFPLEPPAFPFPDLPAPKQIIFPHEINIKALVTARGLAKESHGDLAVICAEGAVQDAVLKDLNLIGKKAGLKPLEVCSPFPSSPPGLEIWR